jgi:pimeloyl-ACP methyl ester carboxylesterase
VPTTAPIRTASAIGSLLALVLLACLILAGPAPAGQSKGPSGNAFYDPPKKLPVSHGKLIWQRKAKGLATIDGAASNTLVLYTSKSPRGKTVAVSGSVSIPKGKPPKAGWPVISYGHGTTGNADSCAPTRVSKKSPVADYVDYIDPQLEDWIDAGYVVVRSDYQGLGTPGPHPYLVGSAAGRSMLDIVSAAEQVEHRIGDRYLVAGHSQGGHAALFAAGEAASYLKKFDLRGAVSYAPGSHILEQAKLLPAFTQPSALSALAALIIDGAATESKQIKVPQLLTEEPLALFPQVGKKCLLQLGKPDSFGGIAPADLLQDEADTGPLYDVLADENPDVKTKAPILLAQGTDDATAYKTFTDQLADELEGAGDDVDYRVYDGVDHGGTPKAAEHDVLRFFKHKLPPKG